MEVYGGVLAMYVYTECHIISVLLKVDHIAHHAKNRLDCESFAKNYILKNKNSIGINKREIKMLSTNFCYGGDEFYELENSKN